MAGLTTAMNTGVSAIGAGAYTTDVASENIASATSVAAKKRFGLIVTNNYDPDPKTFSSGGVGATSFKYNSQVGAPIQTGISTHFTIEGGGFAVVKDITGEIKFTRNCTFIPNNKYELENCSGEILMVQAMDVNGNFLNPDTSTTAGMSVATLANLSGLTAPTKNITLPIILPSSVNTQEVHSIPLVVTDSLGVNHTLTLTFSNPISVINDIQWTMTITPPANPGTDVIAAPYFNAGTPPTGIPVVFNPNGTLASVNGSTTPPSPTLNITWANGATPSVINMNLGTIGQNDGLQVNGTNFLAGAINIDGYQRGNFTGATYTTDGFLTASFDNGQTRTIARVPLATFANPNGLLDQIGGSYQQTVESGPYTLNVAGTGGTGTFTTNAYEGSTIDTTQEYTDLVNDQTLVNGGVQIIRTAKEMIDAIINILN